MMSVTVRTFARASVVLAAGLVITCTSPAASDEHGRQIDLIAGTVAPVKLQSALSSDQSQPGDHFIAKLDDKDGDSGLPPGTKFQGVVTDAHPKHGKKAGTLDITFKRMILPGGKAYRIVGSPINLDDKSVTRGPNGQLIAKKAHRTDRLTYVGYGAGAGLLAGLVTKGHLSIRDTAIGAGLGYLGGAFDKHGANGDVRDVKLKAGTRLGVRIDKSVTFAH